MIRRPSLRRQILRPVLAALVPLQEAGAQAWPAKPVTDMMPHSPWAIWSKPGRSRYGPSCPKPEMLASTMRGLIARSEA